ncbi:hypothetical protein RHSIM_Rhsim02G0034100 [Rhododendron simsii]|uniref:Uncharacterized protein n=1 Tax=Rhododendron simsii TaxID=118357 RepID=A0A834HE67_RHOSS|nr:hypothetical protein RHSIM_Rhsim02G0034100 [Rhododendron simsii]
MEELPEAAMISMSSRSDINEEQAAELKAIRGKAPMEELSEVAMISLKSKKILLSKKILHNKKRHIVEQCLANPAMVSYVIKNADFGPAVLYSFHNVVGILWLTYF